MPTNPESTGASFDYIVVGAGSAGCVMADRLSRDPRNRVLLIEAGGPDRSMLIHMPKGIGKLALNPHHAWHFPVQQPRSPGEKATETWVRGRGLGGSSSINGMIWVKGHPKDYDDWAAAGATGWDWPTMRAAFMAIEDHEMGPGDGRGVGGPVHVSSGTYRYPLAEAAIAAGEQMGLPRHEDLNVEDQDGIGYFSHNIWRGRRQSGAVAFLRPARKRPNLTIVTDTDVRRIRFEGRRAVGVEGRRDGQLVSYDATGEVILSAGAIASPAILQRSGVGPGEVLLRAGIPVVANRRAVGRHLREHLGLGLPHRLRGVPGNNREFQGLGLVKNVLRYGLTHTGPLATGPYEVGAFIRTREGLDRPDLQIYAGAFSFARNNDPAFPIQLSSVEKAPGFTIYGQLLRLKSEGTVEIDGPSLETPLLITPNWLEHVEDQETAVASIRLLRRFASQPALAPYLAEELLPGAHIATDEQILSEVRRLGRCGTHAVGSTAMGGEDAALDADCRVRGVEGVRVIDCGSMPGLVSGNTNAPAMAFAWQMANRMGAPV